MRKNKELTPNYEIMFKSAVSMLQTTYTVWIETQREMFELEHRGWFDDNGDYCITTIDEGYMEELAKKEHYLAEQLEYYIKEVERLRKLRRDWEKENDHRESN